MSDRVFFRRSSSAALAPKGVGMARGCLPLMEHTAAMSSCLPDLATTTYSYPRGKEPQYLPR